MKASSMTCLPAKSGKTFLPFLFIRDALSTPIVLNGILLIAQKL